MPARPTGLLDPSLGASLGAPPRAPVPRCPARQTLLLLVIILVFLMELSTGYKCYTFHKEGQDAAEIKPDNIVVEVADSIEVFCNYNASSVRGDPQFRRAISGEMVPLHTTRVNSSTVSTTLRHNATERYILSCYVPALSNKQLCTRIVAVGYVPQDLKGFRCISPNWSSLNCSWEHMANPISTNYSFAYRVPMFTRYRNITYHHMKTHFVIQRKNFTSNRPVIEIVITGENSLGTVNYTHFINIYEVVVPSPPDNLRVRDSSLTSDSVTLEWEMHYKMDSFPGNLTNEVAWRIPPRNDWNKKVASAKFTEKNDTKQHQYNEQLALPAAYTRYQLRVRMLATAGPVKEHMWSTPAFIDIVTASKLPEQLAVTDTSSFEMSNFLRSRELYVNWRQLDTLQHNGPNLRYRVTARYGDTMQLVYQMPVVSSTAYAKFGDLSNTRSYRFQITAVNDVGAGRNFSELFVPETAQMPDTPEMFTVITYRNLVDEDSRIYRLMWKAPLSLGEGREPIVRYTLFWCPDAADAIRCQEKLQWVSAGENIEALRLEHQSTDLPTLYERNMTGLPYRQKFGIAAVTSGGISSGIKWATCSVPFDDSPPAPKMPTASIINSQSVKLNWNFECLDKASVPLSVNISYCEVSPFSQMDYFSHCTTPVQFVSHGLIGPSLITGLRPSSILIFSLSVISVVGASKNTKPRRLTMPEDVPSGPPQSLVVLAQGNTSVTLGWSPPLPHLANGVITKYEINTVPMSSVVCTPEAQNNATLPLLLPFTRYEVLVAACTDAGCGVAHLASVALTTDPGPPGKVDMFSLNSINGEMTWQFDNCHSSACTYDLRIIYNDSTIYRSGLAQSAISLLDLNITCLESTEITVSIRAVGIGLNNTALYGPWNTKEGPCTVPAIMVLAWWIVLIVVVICILVTVAIFIVSRCSFNVIKEIKRPINIPILSPHELKNVDQKQQHSQSLSPQPAHVVSNKPYTQLHQQIGCNGATSPIAVAVTAATTPYNESKKIPLLSLTSHSSEVQTVEDQHRGSRNLSGNSTESSGGCSVISSEADSALASHAETHETSSAGSSQKSNNCREQCLSDGGLRQRSPGPYVLHGDRPQQNITEETAAAWSDFNLVKDKGTAMQLLTHNLSAPGGSEPGGAYTKSGVERFKHTESDHGEDELSMLTGLSRSRSGVVDSNNVAPYCSAGTPFPIYSRHSLTPPGKQKPSIANIKYNVRNVSHMGDLKYVSVAFNNDIDDSRSSWSEDSNGLLDNKTVPPSMPPLLNVVQNERKNSIPGDMIDADNAYSIVGSRHVTTVPSSQGYVTLSSRDRPVINNDSIATSSSINKQLTSPQSSSPLKTLTQPFNKYHTVGELNAFLNNFSKRNCNPTDDRNVSNTKGYVTLGERGYPIKNITRSGSESDTGSSIPSCRSGYVTPHMLAFHTSRPEQLVTAEEVRFVASAPCEYLRGRFNPQNELHDSGLSPQLNERPNTSDGVTNRPKRLSQSPSSCWPHTGPSLSKQSSGYVSQEALGAEPLVMSPKRLFAQNRDTKVIMSNSQDVSFV